MRGRILRKTGCKEEDKMRKKKKKKKKTKKKIKTLLIVANSMHATLRITSGYRTSEKHYLSNFLPKAQSIQ